MSSESAGSGVYVVFDLETTGTEPEKGDEIIEIGAVPVIEGRIREDCAFLTLVDPARPIPAESRDVHGISDDMVRGKPQIAVVLPEFLRYVGRHALVAQNAEFDLGFLRRDCKRLELTPPPGEVHDTMLMSRRAFPGERRHALDDICRRLGIEVGRRHRSLDDVLYTAQAFLALTERLARRK